MGDLNVNTRMRNKPKCKRLFRFLKTTKLKYLNTKATYFHPRVKSTIDHVYTNCRFVSENGVINAPIYMVKKQLKEITGRSYRTYDCKTLHESIDTVDCGHADSTKTIFKCTFVFFVT